MELEQPALMLGTKQPALMLETMTRLMTIIFGVFYLVVNCVFARVLSKIE